MKISREEETLFKPQVGRNRTDNGVMPWVGVITHDPKCQMDKETIGMTEFTKRKKLIEMDTKYEPNIGINGWFFNTDV